MIRRYVEQILKLYNYIDGVMVTNREGVIEFFHTYRPEINDLTEDEAVGRHILDVYPSLTEQTSSIIKVLKTHEPIYNQRQYLRTYKGQSIQAINNTLPIVYKDEIIGVVEASIYIDDSAKKQNVMLSVREPSSNSDLYTLDDIITQSPKMLKIKEQVKRISQTDSSVLIYGETGTGKELIAQSLHSHSQRMGKRFISQNCAAIPANLLEGILFGTRKGSYTGAEDRKGLFELAKGGTLFLDEINSMERTLQPKLLKSIEDDQVWPLGATKPVRTDVRIVTATNEPPADMMKHQTLRQDLFYRLGVVQIYLPSLNERIEDILLLAEYFIKQYNMKMNQNVIGLSEEVEQLFLQHHWQGNVRELKNIIESAFNMTSNNLIEKRDLPQFFLSLGNKGVTQTELGQHSLNKLVNQYEKHLIQKALECTSNKTEAAQLLKISKQSLAYKLDKHNIG